LHLRLFYHAQSDTREAELLRAHVGRCATCRAIVAELDDRNLPAASSSDRFSVGAQWIDETADSTVILPPSHVPAETERPGDEVRKTPPKVASTEWPPEEGSTDTTVIVTVREGTPRVFEADPNRQTLADEISSPAPHIANSGDTDEFILPSDGKEGPETFQNTVEWSLDSPRIDDSLGFSEAAPRSGAEREENPTGTRVMRSTDESPRSAPSGSGGSSLWRERTDAADAKVAVLQGITVPGYDILEELGRGGMGVVYKARDRRLQRLVALKMVLAGAHAGKVGLARFRAEAEAVAKLLHSNIVQIYETGECDGRPYFSLEYVDGGSLAQRMVESPPTPRAAAKLVETLARTMDVAHQRGIVHRDLKPANILLANIDSQSTAVRSRESDSGSLPANHWSRQTVPKIADFGLAKRVDEDSSQTQSGTILGTPSYMAPEQASGKNREIGPAADIYSLGAILYEMLVARPPFKAGSPIDTVRQVIEQEPVPPRQLEPRVPLDLETICLKCLEKEPAKRFATAAELADDLHRFVHDEPIRARPTPAWERAWKWGKRRPTTVALLAVCALAVVGLVLGIAIHNASLRGRLDEALEKERWARRREQDARDEQRLSRVRAEGQKLFDSARLAVAARDWSSARVDLEKSLTTLAGAARVEEIRDPATALLKKVEKELSVEADRRASGARFQKFVKNRDEAQFLGTLYTGMDLAANLDAARTAAQNALGVYAVLAEKEPSPRLDAHLSDLQKSEIVADCSQLLLILAETQAQSTFDLKGRQKEERLRSALESLEQARRLGAPARAVHLRRSRYLTMLGNQAEASLEEKRAQAAPLAAVLDHFLTADELYRREKFAEAIKEFDHVIEAKPGHFWAQYVNAICLLRQGRPAEARTLLTACLAERSDFAWLYLQRGFAQQELQAWDAADADFQKAAKLPLDDSARYVLSVNRGVLRVRQERFEDAVADLKSAIEKKPKAYEAYANLAQAYRRLNKMDLALQQLNRAVELKPGLAHLYRLRAHLYLVRNEPALALADFDRAIEHESSSSAYQVDDHVERGRLFLAAGKHALALASFDSALALEKDHAFAQRLRAEALFRLGRFQEVIGAFDRYLEKGKPLESVYRGRGLARAELGQYPGAIEDFTKALELHPTSAVQAFRGWTHLVVDAPKLALRDFELAVELDPKSGDAYSGRGFARARLGRHQEAKKDAAEALRLGPPSPRLIYNVARIYAQCPGTGPQRALDLIHQALKLLPDAERPIFWSTHIRTDAAMAALRRYPSFVRLDAELAQRK
jgi:serine/threonine protein kinase/tetratricopeptide (TPR) repeat protein